MNLQLAIYVVHADVIVSQFGLICTTNNVHSFVQFLSDHFGFICALCIVASIFHAIIQCSHFVFTVVVVFVYDTSDTISTIFTVYTILTFFATDSKTIFTVLTIEADRTIFTIDYNGGTVFTVYTDLTINAVFTIFTDLDVIGQCICICLFTSCIIDILSNCQVIAGCIGNSLAVAYSCNCMVTNYIAFRISGEGITVFDLISQTGQVDFCDCTSLVSAVAIVVFQCYGFACCIVSVRCSCFTSTIRCCRSNVQIVSFGNCLNVADVSTVCIISGVVIYNTRFEVRNVVATHVHIAAVEFEFVTADCESSRATVLNCVDVVQVFSQTDVDFAVAISTLSDACFDVRGIVFGISFSACTFNSDFGAKFIFLFATGVSVET